MTDGNKGIVKIHGREYMTVARRLELAHEDRALERVETEVVNHNPVVVRAKVSVKGKTFTGVSAVNPDSPRLIERENPYEVAETSAVGRALGFAGYGLLESVASADEVVRARISRQDKLVETSDLTCEICGEVAVEKKGVTKNGKPYHAIFCSTENKAHTKWLWN